jgi:hypothetical protein
MKSHAQEQRNIEKGKMKTILRALALFAILGRASAVFAGTVDFTVTSGQDLYLDLEGNADGDVTLVNTDTDTTEASFSLLNDADGAYTDQYTGYGSGGSGVSLSLSGYSTISGLPAGDYELTTSSDGYYSFDENMDGDSGYISDYQDFDYGGQMNYTINIE